MSIPETGRYFGFNSTQEHTLRGLDLAAPNSVSTANIQAGAVTGAKLGAMTSAQLRAAVSDETGTGAAVFATSPTLVTPALGTPSALVLTNATGLPAAAVVDVTPTAHAADGAIATTEKVAILSKAGVGAYTLAAPAGNERLILTSTTANAHVVTATSLINDGATGVPHTTLTFAAFAGASIFLQGYSGKWQVISANHVTVS